VVGECEGRYRETILHGFISNTDFGGLPDVLYDDDGNEIADFDDFISELSTHLMDGWVAVLMEIGSEKLRYLTGVAFAVNSKGEYKEVFLDQIYKSAESLGSCWTHCTY
jgi:hypothetical protein